MNILIKMMILHFFFLCKFQQNAIVMAIFHGIPLFGNTTSKHQHQQQQKWFALLPIKMRDWLTLQSFILYFMNWIFSGAQIENNMHWKRCIFLVLPIHSDVVILRWIGYAHVLSDIYSVTFILFLWFLFFSFFAFLVSSLG